MKKAVSTVKFEKEGEVIYLTLDYEKNTYQILGSGAKIRVYDRYNEFSPEESVKTFGKCEDLLKQKHIAELVLEATNYAIKEMMPKPTLKINLASKQEEQKPKRKYGKIKKPAVAAELLAYLRANRVEVSRKSGGVGVPTCVGDIPPALLQADNKMYKAAYNRIYYKKQLA